MADPVDFSAFLNLLGAPEAERRRRGLFMSDENAAETRYDPALAGQHYRNWRSQIGVTQEDAATRPLPIGESHPALWVCVAAAVLAIIAVFPLPIGYYGFLRFALCAAGVVLAIVALRSTQPGWLALAIPMVVLWAPSTWLSLPRETWIALDVLVAAALVGAGLLIPAPQVEYDGDRPFKRWPWWKIAAVVVGVALIVWIGTQGAGYGLDCETVYDGRFPSCL
jgi:hypothetical protein